MLGSPTFFYATSMDRYHTLHRSRWYIEVKEQYLGKVAMPCMYLLGGVAMDTTSPSLYHDKTQHLLLLP